MADKTEWRMMDEFGRLMPAPPPPAHALDDGRDTLRALGATKRAAAALSAMIWGPPEGPDPLLEGLSPEPVQVSGPSAIDLAETVSQAVTRCFSDAEEEPPAEAAAETKVVPAGPTAHALDRTQELRPSDSHLRVEHSSLAPQPEDDNPEEAGDGLTEQERHLLKILSKPKEMTDSEGGDRRFPDHPKDHAQGPKTALIEEQNPAIDTTVQTHTEANMPINFLPPEGIGAQLKPRITVVGVGGAGGNAVNNMILSGLEGVDFVVANTDAQALNHARTDRRIQLGIDVTQGLGAGARPDVGHAAAEESYDTIAKELEGANMVFITAGMGGGTGTGAAPVISRIARDMGILTVGVVTKPFQFEGVHRMRLAEQGIDELAQFVDTLIIIPNQNLFRVANERTTFADAFKMADDVLNSGVRSVTDLMVMPGLINLDFADVRTVMSGMGRAMMGTGEADGENRALQAAEAAIANPLLEDTCMRGARGVLINITGGPDVTLFEVDEAANRIKDEVESPDAHIIFGSCFDEAMEGKMRVSVVATGINAEAMASHTPRSMVAMPGAPRPQPLSAGAHQAAAPAAAPHHPAAPAPAAQPQQHPEPVAQPEPEMAHVQAEEPVAQHAAAEEAHHAAWQATGTHGGLARPTAPATPRYQQPRDVFIPRAPVTPTNAGAHAAAPAHHQPEAPRAAQPAPAAPRPVAQPPRPQPLQSSTPQSRTSIEPEEHRTLAQGLLARMTGLARRATPSPAPAHQEPEVRTNAGGGAGVHHQPQQPRQTEQSRLAADPDDRVQTSSQDDDELEIPAFLRRQAN